MCFLVKRCTNIEIPYCILSLLLFSIVTPLSISPVGVCVNWPHHCCEPQPQHWQSRWSIAATGMCDQLCVCNECVNILVTHHTCICTVLYSCVYELCVCVCTRMHLSAWQKVEGQSISAVSKCCQHRECQQWEEATATETLWDCNYTECMCV